MLEQDHRDAGIDEVHRNTATHRAGTDDGHRVDFTQRRVGGHIRNLGGRALGKEGMAQRFGFRRLHQADEERALQRHAFIEGLGGRGFHRLNTFSRGRKLRHHRLHGIERDHREAFGFRVIDLHVAHQRQFAAVSNHLTRKRHRAFGQIAFDDFIKQRGVGQCFRFDRFARDDHVHRHFERNHPRQALRATGAGQDAQFDFGQRDQCAGQSHPVMTAERQFETTTHRDRMHGGNHGLGRALQLFDHRAQVGFGGGCGRIELANIGAARKGLAVSGQDNSFDAAFRIGADDTVHDAGAQLVPEAIDRRVIHGDDGDIAVLGVAGLSHQSFLNQQ